MAHVLLLYYIYISADHIMMAITCKQRFQQQLGWSNIGLTATENVLPHAEYSR